MPFALHRNHFIAQRRYDALASAPIAQARPTSYPARFPHDLTQRPERAGEASVYRALAKALPADCTIFYDRTVKGARRRIDFLVLIPDCGLIAIEVKGGLVHAGPGAFRQATHSMQGQRSHSKRIEPFRQVTLALGQLWEKSGINPLAIPTFIMAAFPNMSEEAYPWGRATHILTREDFDGPDRLAKRIMESLAPQPQHVAALEVLSAALIANMPHTRTKP